MGLFGESKQEIIKKYDNLLKEKEIQPKQVSINQKDRFLLQIYFENTITNNY